MGVFISLFFKKMLSKKFMASSFTQLTTNTTIICTNSVKQRKNYDPLNNSFYPKKKDTISSNKTWYVIDADGQTLGRLATLAASVIRGKTNPLYHPAMDMGDNVIVVNAEKIKVTGKKYSNKYYFHHTQNKRSGAGRIGGYRIEYFKDLLHRIPERIIEKAVYGMLPKNRLGKYIRVKRLMVYKGNENPHKAQNPKDITHLIDAKYDQQISY